MRLVVIGSHGLKENERNMVNEMFYDYILKNGPIQNEKLFVAFWQKLGYTNVAEQRDKDCGSTGMTCEDLVHYPIIYPVPICTVQQIAGKLKRYFTSTTESNKEDMVLFSQLAVEVPKSLAKTVNDSDFDEEEEEEEDDNDGDREEENFVTSLSEFAANSPRNPNRKTGTSIFASSSSTQNNKNIFNVSPPPSRGVQSLKKIKTVRQPSPAQRARKASVFAAAEFSLPAVFSPETHNNNEINQKKSPEHQHQEHLVKRVPAYLFVDVISEFGFPQEIIEIFKDRAESHPFLSHEDVEDILQDPVENRASINKISNLMASATFASMNVKRARHRIQEHSQALMTLLWRRMHNPNSVNTFLNESVSSPSSETNKSHSKSFFGKSLTSALASGQQHQPSSSTSSPTREHATAVPFSSPSPSSGRGAPSPGADSAASGSIHPVLLLGETDVSNNQNTNNNEISNSSMTLNNSVTSSDNANINNSSISSSNTKLSGEVAKAIQRNRRTVSQEEAEQEKSFAPSYMRQVVSRKEKKRQEENERRRRAAIKEQEAEKTRTTADRDQWQRKIYSLFGDTRALPRKTTADFRFVELSTPRVHQTVQLTTAAKKDGVNSDNLGFASSDVRWWLRSSLQTSGSSRSSSRKQIFRPDSASQLSQQRSPNSSGRNTPFVSAAGSQPRSGRYSSSGFYQHQQQQQQQNQQNNQFSSSSRPGTANSAISGNTSYRRSRRNNNQQDQQELTSIDTSQQHQQHQQPQHHLQETTCLKSKKVPSVEIKHGKDQEPETISLSEQCRRKKRGEYAGEKAEDLLPPFHVQVGKCYALDQEPSAASPNHQSSKKEPVPVPHYAKVNPFSSGHGWDEVL